MINQKSPLFQKWLDEQAANPPKGRDRLARVDGVERRCCLGNLCVVAGAARSGEDPILFSGCSAYLPNELAREINIGDSGTFTKAGCIEASRFCAVGLEPRQLTSLTHVNDDTGLDHRKIGELIKHLADIEAKEGVEMFEPFEEAAK